MSVIILHFDNKLLQALLK